MSKELPIFDLEQAGAYKLVLKETNESFIILVSGYKPFLTVEEIWSINKNRFEPKDNVLRGAKPHTIEKINLAV